MQFIKLNLIARIFVYFLMMSVEKELLMEDSVKDVYSNGVAGIMFKIWLILKWFLVVVD